MVPKKQQQQKEPLVSKRIFVGGIDFKLTQEELKQHFAAHGRVLECQIMRDANNNQSRGFGFITFEDEKVANRLIEQKVTHINGRKADIKPAEQKTERRERRPQEHRHQESQKAPVPSYSPGVVKKDEKREPKAVIENPSITPKRDRSSSPEEGEVEFQQSKRERINRLLKMSRTAQKDRDRSRSRSEEE